MSRDSQTDSGRKGGQQTKESEGTPIQLPKPLPIGDWKPGHG